MKSTNKINQKVLKTTISDIIKQDPDYKINPKLDSGFTLINSREDLFYHFDVNRIIEQLIKKRYFKKKYNKHKFIFFITRDINKELFKSKTYKMINFPSAYLQKPEITLAISDIINLYKHKWEGYVLFEHFLKSLYYQQGSTDAVWYANFRGITDVLEKNNITNIDNVIDVVEKFHKKETGEWCNFKYICDKYGLQQYFSQKSDINSILDGFKYFIFKINKRFDKYSTVYPNILCLLLCYIAEYYRSKNIKTIIIIDDIHAFFSLQTCLNTLRMSDMFEMALRCLNNDSPFGIANKKDYFFHKVIFALFTKNIFQLGNTDKEIGESLHALLFSNKKIIFEIDGFFLYLLQRYLNYDIQYISSIINTGNEIRKFWQEKPERLPFMIGYPDNFRASNEINLNISPIDFRKYDLTPSLLFRILEAENGIFEFKGNYKNAVDNIIKNVITFLKHKGGNIIIGIDNKNRMPDGIDLKKEGFEDYDKMIESMYQTISSNISPVPNSDLIDIKHFLITRRNFVTISIWPGKKGIKYTNKKGKSWNRFGNISLPDDLNPKK